MLKTRPTSVCIAKNPTPRQSHYRGPVELTYEGKTYVSEIDHDPSDPNNCSSLIQLENKEFVSLRYTLQDIVDLQPENVPYLTPLSDGKYC